jgi:hypothetical protein
MLGQVKGVIPVRTSVLCAETHTAIKLGTRPLMHVNKMNEPDSPVAARPKAQRA